MIGVLVVGAALVHLVDVVGFAAVVDADVAVEGDDCGHSGCCWNQSHCNCCVGKNYDFAAWILLLDAQHDVVGVGTACVCALAHLVGGVDDVGDV